MSWLVTVAFIAVAFIVHVVHVSNENKMEGRIWDLQHRNERLIEENTSLIEKLKEIEENQLRGRRR
jgi:hypothetical protein